MLAGWCCHGFHHFVSTGSYGEDQRHEEERDQHRPVCQQTRTEASGRKSAANSETKEGPSSSKGEVWYLLLLNYSTLRVELI